MKSCDALLIDAGTGNLHSVHNALMHLGFRVQVTSSPEAILHSPGRLVLPGVGAFGAFMQGLRQRGLVEPLQAAFRRGDPILGICVGMQAMLMASEEMGDHAGLGLLAGRVVRFPHSTSLKVPHTGWNQLWFQNASPLFRGLPAGSYAYFNHSFYCANENEQDTAATTDYGLLVFTSAIEHENLFGVQFHPEKSQYVGQQVLANFFRV
jgi:glutamine amidotransferase